MAGGPELGDLQGPFQPKSFYDSMILIWAPSTQRKEVAHFEPSALLGNYFN